MHESSAGTFHMVVWRLLRAGVYVVLAGVVVFFAFTRTDVGRDGIRRQLQSAFNERYAGTLEIGALQGTLLNDLRATNVRLRGEDGQLIASIDSMASSPNWRNLLGATFSVGSLTLIRPQIALRRDEEGRWNLRKALTRTAPSYWNFLVEVKDTDIRIQNGRVTTDRTGPAPPPRRTRMALRLLTVGA